MVPLVVPLDALFHLKVSNQVTKSIIGSHHHFIHETGLLCHEILSEKVGLMRSRSPGERAEGVSAAEELTKGGDLTLILEYE